MTILQSLQIFLTDGLTFTLHPNEFIVSKKENFNSLILIIIFSHQDHKKEIPRFEPKIEIFEKDASEKKLKISKNKIVKKK